MFDGQFFGTSIDDIPSVAMKLLSNAVIQTGDHVIITDNNGLVEYVNPAFTAFTGYTLAELYQQKLSVLKSDEHPRGFYQGLWQTILAGEIFRATFINRKKNGDIYYEEKTITPIQDKGVISHFISVGRDITQRMNLEKRARSLELEKERVQILEEFISSASHDFRTPLTAMKLHLHLLEQDIADKSLQPRLDILKSQLFYLNRVSENMLTLFKLKGGIVTTFTNFHVNHVIEDIVKRVGFLFEQKNITVKCTLVPNPPSIFGNEIMLMRAVSNLIENALYYTPKGGSVEIHTEVLSNQFILQICDTGIGIKPEHLPRIFEQFYKPDETYAQHGLGMGLGLRIVKRIVEMHSGSVEVASEPNQGTVFTIFLPIHNLVTLQNNVVC